MVLVVGDGGGGGDDCDRGDCGSGGCGGGVDVGVGVVVGLSR